MTVKTGRPPFKPTKALREQVEVLRAAGFDEEAIAIALGIVKRE
jgi:hypothetical protein